MSYPECDKLKNRSDDWNTIYPFIEWIQDVKKYHFARFETDEELLRRVRVGRVKVDSIAEALRWSEHKLLLMSGNIQDLLYEYFDVNPAELERERRELLSSLREAEVVPREEGD